MESRELNRSLFWGLVAVSAALVIGSFAVGSALKDVRRSGDQITVTGSARRAVRSDFVIWRVTVSGQSAALGPAAQELQRLADRVRAFLRDQRVDTSAITVHPIETSPIPEVSGAGHETGRVLGYRLTQMFEVRSKEVDEITRVSQRIVSLISDGVPVVASAPSYLFTGLASVRLGLLTEATQDARARAEAIAKSTGASVGTVREARMGVFQITPRYSTEISGYGINDETSIEKDVTAVVGVTFALR
jgi:hypothetical protein